MSESLVEDVVDQYDPDGLWRLYRQEWLVRYVSFAHGSDGWDECVGVFSSRYAGRVRPDDVRYASAAPECGDVDAYPCRLELRQYNLLGEFKGWDTAQTFARESRDRSVVVAARGSREERAMLDYGVRALSDAELAAEPCAGCDVRCGACPRS